MGLIDEICTMWSAVPEQKNPERWGGVDWLCDRVGSEAVDAALLRFADQFRPGCLHREIGLQAYMEGETAGIPHGTGVGRAVDALAGQRNAGLSLFWSFRRRCPGQGTVYLR